jgi:hypothetical protein
MAHESIQYSKTHDQNAQKHRGKQTLDANSTRVDRKRWHRYEHHSRFTWRLSIGDGCFKLLHQIMNRSGSMRNDRARHHPEPRAWSPRLSAGRPLRAMAPSHIQQRFTNIAQFTKISDSLFAPFHSLCCLIPAVMIRICRIRLHQPSDYAIKWSEF